jgi:cobyrinic acid a,c-diamide synthase
MGLVAAWRGQGRTVAPFKKGPDYIDAAWLSAAANQPCRNLDLFLMDAPVIRRSFMEAALHADVAVVEGNRGLFDGLDEAGTCSTAELAKLLDTPVLLILDCTKATRTVAAVVVGCRHLDPALRIGGVILNRVRSGRHESVIRAALRQSCDVPVLGAIPRTDDPLLPERHLGLIPPDEHARHAEAIDRAADVARHHLDLDGIWRVAADSAPLAITDASPGASSAAPVARVGVFRDAAFQFYYPENLEALTRAGAEVIELSPIGDSQLPDVDALYLGGGFPETLAPALAKNTPFLASVRRAVEDGMPVYAECGGAVFLGERLRFDGHEYPMAGAVPAVFGFRRRPQGHGYTVLETIGGNPFYPVGTTITGHEFHYTYLDSSETRDLPFAFRVRRGHGFDGLSDGLCWRNVLACYTHVHALGTDSWAPAIVREAVRYRSREPIRAVPFSRSDGTSMGVQPTSHLST